MNTVHLWTNNCQEGGRNLFCCHFVRNLGLHNKKQVASHLCFGTTVYDLKDVSHGVCTQQLTWLDTGRM